MNNGIVDPLNVSPIVVLIGLDVDVVDVTNAVTTTPNSLPFTAFS